MEIGNFLKVLDYYNVEYQDFGDTFRARCPIHGGNNPTAFALKKDNALWKCHSCHAGGDLVSFIEFKEDVHFKDAMDILSNILGDDVSNLQINKERGFLAKNSEKYIKLVNSLNKEDGNNEIKLPNAKFYNLNKYRGFTNEVLSFFKVKYCENFTYLDKNGDTKSMGKRITFPIYRDGVLIGLSNRRVDNYGPKWFHYPRGIKTADILFNLDNIKPFEPIIVVEGIIDVLKFHSVGLTNVVAVLGSHLSQEQENLLIQYTDTLYLCFDNDEAGQHATHDVKKRLRFKFNLFTIDLKIYNDPNDVPDDILLNLYTNAIRG